MAGGHTLGLSGDFAIYLIDNAIRLFLGGAVLGVAFLGVVRTCSSERVADRKLDDAVCQLVPLHTETVRFTHVTL
jgi:hypothetical protein